MRGFLFAGMMLSVMATADTREANKMADILATVDADTLLIFDLDNTIIATDQELGSDQWVDHLLEEKSLKDTLALWKAVQRVSGVQPVEKDTPTLILEKQNAGVKTMGLTARTVDMADRTLAQLQSVGVDLGKTTVRKNEMKLKTDPDIDFHAQFKQGVLFSGNNKKGPMFVEFIKKIGLKPKRIVFVDDKKKNVESVEAALDKLTIPHTSYRYGAADATVKGYRQEIADVQLQFFGKVLDDNAAGAILRERNKALSE